MRREGGEEREGVQSEVRGGGRCSQEWSRGERDGERRRVL